MRSRFLSGNSIRPGVLLGCLFLLLPTATWSQEPYTIEALRFLPPEFYVGQPVELRITLKVPESVPVAAPETLPEAEWITLRDLEVLRKGDITDIRILFISFQPGLKNLFPLDLEGISLEPIKVHTLSVLDAESPDFQDPAGPRLLPGTLFLLGTTLALLLTVPVAVITLIPGIKQRITALLLRRRRKKPYERLKKALNRLSGAEEPTQLDEFYSLLLREFRGYLAFRGGKEFLSATAGEVEGCFQRLMPDFVYANELIGMFRRGDEVRFGGASVEREVCRGDLALVQSSADCLEGLKDASTSPGKEG